MEFLIDTGAGCSLVDRRLVEALRLEAEGPREEITFFGRRLRARKVVVPEMRLGASFGDVPCFVVDLPEGSDVLLGMDQLRRRNFTIDYERGQLRFGQRGHFAAAVPFERGSPYVIVSMDLGQRTLRLVVDSGTPDTVILPTPKLACWLGDNLTFAGVWCMRDLTGCSLAPIVELPDARLGNRRWKGLKAGVRENPLGFADGYLGLSSLRLKQIYFDFDEHLLSWEK